MNYSLVGINHHDLLEKLNQTLKFEIDDNEIELDKINKIKEDYSTWENSVEKNLAENINPIPKQLIDLFKYSDTSIMDDFVFGYGEGSKAQKEIQRLQKKIDLKKTKLKLIIDYILITDSFIGIEKKDIFEVQDKIDFLLEKLKVLYNDNYYSIKIIFDLNSIEYRSDEPQELAEILHKRNYLIKKELYTSSDEVKISIKGASYIERKTKTIAKANSKKNENSNLDAKIDTIISKLTELGFGQKIIFEELEELRDLQTKLPKKTWGQLLKGKLLDLALSEIISKETATYIFENLTNEYFKMLK